MQSLPNRGTVLRKLRGRQIFLNVARAEVPALSVDSPEGNLHHRPRSYAAHHRIQCRWCEQPVKTHQGYTGESCWRDQTEATHALWIPGGEMIGERSAQ